MAAAVLTPHFDIESGVMFKILNTAASYPHVMDFDHIRALSATFSLMNKSIIKANDYNSQNPDFPLSEDKIESYFSKRMIFSLFWGFSSSLNMSARVEFGRFITSVFDASSVTLPPVGDDLIDYEVSIEDGEWVLWRNRVPEVNIEVSFINAKSHSVVTQSVIF
jgi:dynein heavy chain 1